jgi:hypothetical protein
LNRKKTYGKEAYWLGALVTRGFRGIGAGTASAPAEENAHVVIGDAVGTDKATEVIENIQHDLRNR